MWLGLGGFGIVFIAACIILAVAYVRRKSPPTFREISSFARLRRGVGRAVEDGRRLHVALGHGNLTTPQSGADFAGLSMLSRLAELTSASDQPPIATSGDAALSLLSQDTLQAAGQIASRGVYEATNSRLTGLSPFSYAAGALPVIRDENVSTNVLIGHFGLEAALLTDAADRENAFALAASDNLAAQAVMYASSQDTLIGEEVFAAGAYVDAGPFHAASLTAQDILRWIIIGLMVFGALLKLVGLL